MLSPPDNISCSSRCVSFSSPIESSSSSFASASASTSSNSCVSAFAFVSASVSSIRACVCLSPAVGRATTEAHYHPASCHVHPPCCSLLPPCPTRRCGLSNSAVRKNSFSRECPPC